MKYSAGSYHLRMTGRLWWCRPLARESRSTSRFATAPRFCSCCSSGAAPPLRRCLSGHDALLEKKKKKWQERWNNQREKGFNPVAVQRLLPSSTRPRCGLGLSPCRIFLSSLCSLLCIPLIRKLPGRADYQFPLNRPFITNASISPSAYAYILCHFVWEALSFLRVDAESLFF